jgi:hypothetical protein
VIRDLRGFQIFFSMRISFLFILFFFLSDAVKKEKTHLVKSGEEVKPDLIFGEVLQGILNITLRDVYAILDENHLKKNNLFKGSLKKSEIEDLKQFCGVLKSIRIDDSLNFTVVSNEFKFYSCYGFNMFSNDLLVYDDTSRRIINAEAISESKLVFNKLQATRLIFYIFPKMITQEVQKLRAYMRIMFKGRDTISAEEMSNYYRDFAVRYILGFETLDHKDFASVKQVLFQKKIIDEDGFLIKDEKNRFIDQQNDVRWDLVGKFGKYIGLSGDAFKIAFKGKLSMDEIQKARMNIVFNLLKTYYPDNPDIPDSKIIK